MKKFESMLKSEIKKINKAAQQRDNTDSVITGYSSYRYPDELGYIKVTCEICSNNMETRMDDLTFFVYLPDRRRSFVPKYQLNR